MPGTVPIRVRRAEPVRTFLALAVLALLAGCEIGADGDGRATPSVPTTTVVPRQDLVQRHRAAIGRALAVDAACVAPRCSTPAGLLRRADAIAAVLVPLDDALARSSKADAKSRERTATSAFRHAVQQLDTCFELSAAQHGGAPDPAECRGPVVEFQEAVALVRAATIGAQ